MASLLDKVTTLLSANLHALVDKALQNNSIAVFDEYIRQVEDQMDKLADAAATIGGQIKGIQRAQADQEEKAAELDRAVDAFLRDGNDSAAAAAQNRLNSSNALIDTYKVQLEKIQVEYKIMLEAKVKLDSRLETMKTQRSQLIALLELAKSKELAAKSMKTLDALKGVGNSDVAQIANSIYARLDKASAAIEIRSTTLDDQIDEALGRKEIEGQLEQRRLLLGPGKK
ncbi:MAG: PspA/IM30 family protein [Anaerolineales bacterium]|nr:PspA/IM30 family protein [Anaerolineales bacterium]